ncbi:arylesterase [Sneathiella glossodoripedis]|uniref:arylesterase n=1 Tax=Sneathiella glossodoripedis TaxID=418853 RepID=UPI0004714610|nr:arylesterase [Sneathiella glossodoripedis]
MHLINRFMAYGKSARKFNFSVSVCLIFFIVTYPAYANSDTKRILAFGDSLTAGYGLSQQDAFPVQLQAALNKKGFDVTIENAGVSGDTSTGGLQRLDWALSGNPHAVILELGANDALRGIEPSVTRKNMEAIITKIQAKNIPVFLTGMKAPPNMGNKYQEEFDSIFPDLANKYDIALYPFFLEGVAAVEDLNQEDAIHPNKDGVAVIVQNMLPSLIKFLQQNKI